MLQRRTLVSETEIVSFHIFNRSFHGFFQADTASASGDYMFSRDPSHLLVLLGLFLLFFGSKKLPQFGKGL